MARSIIKISIRQFGNPESRKAIGFPQEEGYNMDRRRGKSGKLGYVYV